MSYSILKERIVIKDKGSISIIALLIMSVMLIAGLFLVYLSNMEYFIVNSSLNSIQAYYLSESKIDLVIKDEKYYKEQLLPRIKTYIKLGRITPMYSRNILIDSEDLFKGDSNNRVTVDFNIEDRMNMELETYSICNDIRQDLYAKFTIINDFFELKSPLLSIDLIQQDRMEEFLVYMAHIEENIGSSEEMDDIMVLEVINYNKIKLNQLMDGRISIEYYRNDREEPIKRETLISDEIFLLARDDHVFPTLTIESEQELGRLVLKGIIYLEGDLEINCNFDFSGILISNRGNIIIDSSKEVDIDGIVLLKEPATILLEGDNINIDYNFSIIRKYGLYLPRFIDPKVEIIKN